MKNEQLIEERTKYIKVFGVEAYLKNFLEYLKSVEGLSKEEAFEEYYKVRDQLYDEFNNVETTIISDDSYIPKRARKMNETIKEKQKQIDQMIWEPGFAKFLIKELERTGDFETLSYVRTRMNLLISV